MHHVLWNGLLVSLVILVISVLRTSDISCGLFFFLGVLEGSRGHDGVFL